MAKKKRLLAPREEIAWYPAIDAEMCNGCEECAEFCRPGVFALGLTEKNAEVVKRPKMTVAHPMNCLVLCTRCLTVCPSGAITLPDPADFEQFVEYID